MSYCRFGLDGSDCYVIATGVEFLCYCKKNPAHSTATAQEMLDHLLEHKRNGLESAGAIDRLKKEISEGG